LCWLHYLAYGERSGSETVTTALTMWFFSIEIVSLPVGGMITRMAWGMTIRRSVKSGTCRWTALFGLALVDRYQPGANDSDM